MFGLLKKKLNTFSDKLKTNLNNKHNDELPPVVNEITTKATDEITPAQKMEEAVVKQAKKTVAEIEQPVAQDITNEITSTNETVVSEKEQQEIEKLRKEMEEELEEFKEDVNETSDEETAKAVEKKKEELIEEIEDDEDTPEAEEIEDVVVEKPRDIEIKKVSEDKRELKAKIGTSGKIKGLFSGKVEIKASDVTELLFELELSLIEGDVEQDAAHEIVEKIKARLVGQKVSSKNIDEILQNLIKEILTEMMETKKIDLLEEIKNSKKPYKILMLGPNGAGKTTSMAKLTKLFQDKGLTCVWAAGDTFRAGAIDQLQIHADNLNVKIIKQQYGADPAAVAFDALQSAKASNADVVLIDTAGRQETNKNLMEELKKIERVLGTSFKIYVGEAYTGQGLLDMANEFDNALGIDGFILTKIDTDAKGGTTISLLYRLKKPILYVGTGQEYGDFEEFTPEFVLNRII